MSASAGRERVCFPFVGDLVGGSHVSALKLVRALAGTRYEPLVLVHQAGDLGPYLARQEIASRPAPVGIGRLAAGRGGPVAAVRRALFIAGAAPRLARFLREEGVRVVHTNDGRMHALWAPAARLAGVPLVWHHRGDPTARGVNLLAPLLADRIVTVSRFARPARPIRPVDNRLSVLHSPFDPPPPGLTRAEARAALLAEIGADPDAFVLGYVGWFIERKRPVTFVDVVAATRARTRRPVVGVLFGASVPGERRFEEAVAERAAALGIGGCVHLMGFHPDPHRIMASLDAMVVTALAEPFGRTLIEAMMAGTPVVASDHGGNPEAIRHGRTGFLVPPDDIAGFGAMLAALADDSDLAERIRSSAQQDTNQRYSVAAHATRISEIYDSLIAA